MQLITAENTTTSNANMNIIYFQETPLEELPIVPAWHPDIHYAYLNGEELPEGHPSVMELVREINGEHSRVY
jgi:hypothetical protein